MTDAAFLAALLRNDLASFIWKTFLTVSPGRPYMPNWHVMAIIHELLRVLAGEIYLCSFAYRPAP